MDRKRTYFPGLNALRFFAATLVIFHHLEQYKYWSDKPSRWGLPVIDALGHKPVGFFFVLSGFLITYLLLEERQKKPTINLSQFYLKRIFRIWPLYFVIVFTTLIIVPQFSGLTFGSLPSVDKTAVLLPLLFMIPNLLRISFPQLIGANQLWSVGIEEQFYLFWPLLIRRFGGQVIRFLCLFILLKLAVHLALLGGLHFHQAQWLVKLEKLYALFPVEQMAIGGFGASFLFLGKNRLLKIMGSKLIGVFALSCLLVSSFFKVDLVLYPMMEAVVFMILIYQITSNEKIYKYLDIKALNYLGSISYGIYMWHTVAIAICITLADALEWKSYWAVSLPSITLTLILSAISYRYLERPLLSLKKKLPVFQYTNKSIPYSHA